jgi:hypothetical protein
MVPLYVSVLGMTSTLRGVQVLPAEHEAFAAGLNMARVLIVTASSANTSTTVNLSQGTVVVTTQLATSMKSDASLQDPGDCQSGGTVNATVIRFCNAINYWKVTVKFRNTYNLTGTAVQYVMFQPDKDYVYLLDFKIQ